MLVTLDVLKEIQSKSQNNHINLKTLYKILQIPSTIVYDNYDIEHIMELIPRDKHELSGYFVKINSIRLQLFKEQYASNKIVECVCCGIKATHFKLEGQVGVTPHLNLYANDELLTKDHIHPKSLGGKDVLTNLQVMCNTCNVKKGNLL